MTAYQIRPLCRNRFPDLLLRIGHYHRMSPSGSNSEVGRPYREVSLTLKNGNSQPGPLGPKGAEFGLIRSSKRSI